MQEMIPFTYEGTPMRTLSRDGEPWFVLADLCRVLDIANVGNVAARLDVLNIRQTEVENSRGQMRRTLIVNEPGMYEVVLRSDKTEATSFRRWITHEVLPSIRKRGMYATPAAAEAMLQDPDVLIRVLEEVKAERAKRSELEQLREVEKPKVLFADSVATSDTTILVGDLAKILKGNGFDVGANRLFAMLREDGFLIKRKGTDWNMPTQRAMELGLFKIKESSHIHSDGHVTISKTPKVTGKGQTYLVNHYLKEMSK